MILLDRQNNFVRILKIMSNTAQNFDILVWVYIIILILPQNYFQI